MAFGTSTTCTATLPDTFGADHSSAYFYFGADQDSSSLYAKWNSLYVFSGTAPTGTPSVSPLPTPHPTHFPTPMGFECGAWLVSLGGGANCAGTLNGSIGASVAGTTEGFGSVIGNRAHDVFYAVTFDDEAVACADAGMLRFDSCNSSFDTWLRLYDAETGDRLASCDDCGGCGVRTVLTAPSDLGRWPRFGSVVLAARRRVFE